MLTSSFDSVVQAESVKALPEAIFSSRLANLLQMSQMHLPLHYELQALVSSQWLFAVAV